MNLPVGFSLEWFLLEVFRIEKELTCHTYPQRALRSFVDLRLDVACVCPRTIEPLAGSTAFPWAAERGDWRVVISLALGSLLCGFFWEMWNYYSYPKWIYHTPGAEFARIFELPLLGYGGYVPFALELYAMKTLFWPGGPRFLFESARSAEQGSS